MGTLYFKVNDNLELRLENNETNIYVNNELFRHCKYLLFNIPVEEVKKYDRIDSIDEAAEYLNKDNEAQKTMNIPAHIEFWGHCSNLQAWYENDYDTRILHSNLAFPLLRKLTESGDLTAKRAFKDEIAKRLHSNYEPVIEYLIKGKYLDCLNEEELETLTENNKSLATKLVKYDKIKYIKHLDKQKITRLNLRFNQLRDLPYNISQLSNLKELNLGFNQLRDLPDDIFSLAGLEKLYLGNNQLETLPKNITKLSNLKELNLSLNKLKELPENINKLKNLKKLNLEFNQLRDLPDGVFQLANLKKLSLNCNGLKELPYNISQLVNMEKLSLNCNGLKELPVSLFQLANLKKLYLSNNQLETLPESITQLTHLEELNLEFNQLKTQPKWFKKMKKKGVQIVL